MSGQHVKVKKTSVSFNHRQKDGLDATFPQRKLFVGCLSFVHMFKYLHAASLKEVVIGVRVEGALILSFISIFFQC